MNAVLEIVKETLSKEDLKEITNAFVPIFENPDYDYSTRSMQSFFQDFETKNFYVEVQCEFNIIWSDGDFKRQPLDTHEVLVTAYNDTEEIVSEELAKKITEILNSNF